MTNLQLTSCFSSKFRNKTRMPTMTTFIPVALGVLSIAIRQEKEVKGIQIGEEKIKLSIFIDNMVIYINTEPKTS